MSIARQLPARYEDMTPADLDALYLRLAQAIKRFEVRRSVQPSAAEPLVPETLTITQPAPLTPPAGHRGPYRPRRAVAVTTSSRA